MMATPTLDDLFAVPTQEQALEQEVLPELRLRSVKVTSWLVGSVYRAMAYVVSSMRVSVRKAIGAMAAAGFEDYAFGFSTPPNGIDVTAWAPVIAKQRYGLDRIEASYTKRRITLTNSVATPYGPLLPGKIIISFPSGNRYVLDEAVTIPASDSIDAIFSAQYAHDSMAGRDYNTDPSGATIVLVTSNFPGVVATNPETTYSDVAQVGSGVGTVTPSGTPTGTHSVAVRIDSTGNEGDSTVAWSTSVDGGAWVAGAGSTGTNLGGYGIDITLDDNSGDPAFGAGALYYFSAPGSDIVSTGRDLETPQELGARCRGLIPLIAAVKDDAGNWIPVSPTASGYEYLARTASDQVKIAFVTGSTVNNEVRIYIAGQGVLVGPEVLATVQGYLDSFSMLTDLPVVLSPTTATIVLAGMTVTVARGQLATVQVAMQRAIQLYLGGVDTHLTLSVNGKIDHAYLVSLIRTTPGVVRVTDTTFTINGAAADLQLPETPGEYEIAKWAQQVATAFTWAEE